VKIWFNPNCSKCRIAKSALDEAGIAHEEKRYLDDPPTAAELDEVLRMVGIEPWDLARMKEPRAKELGLDSLPHDRAKWIALMVENPVLIERPIVIRDDGRAFVARSDDSLKRALQLP
jgi:arsenate reductase